MIRNNRPPPRELWVRVLWEVDIPYPFSERHVAVPGIILSFLRNKQFVTRIGQVQYMTMFRWSRSDERDEAGEFLAAIKG